MAFRAAPSRWRQGHRNLIDSVVLWPLKLSPWTELLRLGDRPRAVTSGDRYRSADGVRSFQERVAGIHGEVAGGRAWLLPLANVARARDGIIVEKRVVIPIDLTSTEDLLLA